MFNYITTTADLWQWKPVIEDRSLKFKMYTNYCIIVILLVYFTRLRVQ
jgi:hypothetical protein